MPRGTFDAHRCPSRRSRVAWRRGVVERRLRPGGPRARPLPLPRRAARWRLGLHLRVSGWQPGQRGGRPFGGQDRRHPLRSAVRRGRRLARSRLRAYEPFRRRPLQRHHVAEQQAFHQRRPALGHRAAARAHRPQDVARLRPVRRRRPGRGHRRNVAARHQRVQVRDEVHRRSQLRPALVPRPAPLRTGRFPPGALEARLSHPVQAAGHDRQHPGPAQYRVAHRVDLASVGDDRRGMDFLGEGLRRAVASLLSGDAEVYGIALLTLKIGLIATVFACGLGILVGFVLATKPFWGRRAALTVVNTALAFPTVVVGLLLYGLLSRRGPLGGLEWLYTWQAIVVGDVVLALPIAAALAAAAVQGVDPRIRRTAETLGAGRWRTAWTVAREARFALAAVITTAFGHVVAEIGSAMTVGGNIRGQTRTLTTAVALYTSQGDFGLALALGLILLLLALLVNVALQALQGRGHA